MIIQSGEFLNLWSSVRLQHQCYLVCPCETSKGFKGSRASAHNNVAQASTEKRIATLLAEPYRFANPSPEAVSHIAT